MYSNVFFAQNMFMFYAADSGSEKMQIRIDSTEEGILYILQYYYSRQIWNIIVINHTSWAVGCSDAGTRRTGCINLAWHCCCLPVRRKNFFCIVKASLSIRINFMLGCVVYVSISVVCCVASCNSLRKTCIFIFIRALLNVDGKTWYIPPKIYRMLKQFTFLDISTE